MAATFSPPARVAVADTAGPSQPSPPRKAMTVLDYFEFFVVVNEGDMERLNKFQF
jgi:hypothetical protein